MVQSSIPLLLPTLRPTVLPGSLSSALMYIPQLVTAHHPHDVPATWANVTSLLDNVYGLSISSMSHDLA